MLLVFQMPDTNNHQGWKPTEQFRVPLRISQQLWAFSEACESTFLSSGQSLQTFIKVCFFWITCEVIYCKTQFLLCDEKGMNEISAYCWLTYEVLMLKKADKDRIQATKQKGRQREDRTPQQTSCPQENSSSLASSQLCPVALHLTWLVFISIFWQPFSLFVPL